LLLFVLGSGAGVVVSAAGWWEVAQSARQDRLRDDDLAMSQRVSQLTVWLMHMQVQASRVLYGSLAPHDARDALARSDAKIRAGLAYLRGHVGRGEGPNGVGEFAERYARLAASQHALVAQAAANAAAAKRLFEQQTQPLYEQALASAAALAPARSTSGAPQSPQVAAARAANALLAAGSFAALLFGLAMTLGRRFVRAHEHNEQSRRLAAAVFESSSEAVLITTRDARIVQVNPAFSVVTGYRPEDVIGRNPSMFASGHQDTRFYRAMWHAVLTAGAWQGEIWNRRRNGELYPEWLSIRSVYDRSGKIAYFVASFSDITERKRAQEKLAHQIHHDALTGLPNRVLFKDRLDRSLVAAQRAGHARVALLFIDLDRFKLVNDSLGHAAGDQLLQAVAQRLQRVGRETDTVARLGGDEFAILLPDAEHLEQGVAVAEKVRAAFAEPFVVDGQDIFVSASIGVASAPDDGRDVDVLMQHADIAMYRAKKLGRDRFHIYTQALGQQSRGRLQLENQLHRALDARQLVLHYQPQFDLATGRLRGVEALVRWQHPQLGMISPAEFIPLAEESGMIVPIGAWVLETACKQAHAWQKAGFPSMVMSVNLSVRQFFREDIARLVMQALDEYCLDAHVLELEITESVAMEDVAYTIRALEALAAGGLRVAIDDFGTGYSSLGQLKKMPVKILKIDRSFVKDVTNGADDAEIVNAVITMAHRLGLKVVAEGVETPAQLAHLREQQCDYAQGFLFSAALPAPELACLLQEWDFSCPPASACGAAVRP
jgi:diguanylate cyclase (GGDEF)-like protein/PAS domain S-box-containing protein